MKILKQITTDAYQKKGYISFLGEKKSYILKAIGLFMLFQLLISIIIPIIFFIPGFKDSLHDGKQEFVSFVENQDFTYIGIDKDSLITDLANQPYIITNDSATQYTIFGIDSTGEMSESELRHHKGKTVTGILFMKDRVVTKSSTDYKTYLYSEFTEGNTFLTTKTEILSTLKSGKIEKELQKILYTPKVITILIFATIVFILILAVISMINMTVWALIVGGIAHIMLKKERFASTFKLGFLTYISSWYIRTTVGYLQQPRLASFTKWGLMIASVYVIYTILATIKKSED